MIEQHGPSTLASHDAPQATAGAQRYLRCGRTAGESSGDPGNIGGSLWWIAGVVGFQHVCGPEESVKSLEIS